MATREKIRKRYYYNRNSSNRQIICFSTVILLFFMLAVAPATACATMTVPETTITDLFSPAPDDNVNIQLDTGSTITPESLENLQNAFADTTHSFSYNSATGVYSCYNDAQMTRLITTDKGVRISAPGGDIEYRLTGIGREDRMHSSAEGVVIAEGRLLEISRPGYTEWYSNNDDAIMQGMDIAKRPGGDGNLLVDFALSGSLSPSMDNQVLILSDDAGPVLKYDNLRAWDSTGRRLDAVMKLSGDVLRWEVDDSYAVYPVTIDPAWTQTDVKYGQDNIDYFGWGVAISGDYAIVGTGDNDSVGGDAGVAIFYKTTDGGVTWAKKQVKYGAAANDHFGRSVSISGNNAVVGSILNGVGGPGAAYFYKTSDSGESWTEKQKIPGAAAGDQFGYSVSISGNYAVVGTILEDTGGADAGAAYFYKTADGGTTWTAADDNPKTGAAAGDHFGNSVAISGDYAVVGAPSTANGAAYFYRTTDSGATWAAADDNPKTGAAANDNFGNFVMISGDYAVVGAPDNDDGGAGAGAAYFYTTADGSSWTQKQAKYPVGAGENFGCSVAVSGAYAIVGAQSNDTPAADAGAAYFYKTTDSGATWIKTQAECGVDGNYRFGYSVAVNSSGYALIGAIHAKNPSAVLAGAAYFYVTPPAVTGITPDSYVTDSNIFITNLAGNGFDATATAKLTKTGQTDIDATNLSVESSTKITCDFDLTNAAAGLWNVAVTTSAGTGTGTDLFKVNASPTVTAITPAAKTTGTKVFITNLAGTGFLAGATVKLIKAGQTDIDATNLTVLSATKITCDFDLTGVAAGTWNVKVTNTDGGEGTGANLFTVNAVPAPVPAGGGDAGGGSTGAAAGTVSNVQAGETAQIFMNCKECAVYEVDVRVTTDTKEILVTATKENLHGLPSTGTPTYQYVDIKAYKVDPAAIDESEIYFSVVRSWLTNNGFEPTDVVMKHYNAETKEWENLPNEVTSIAGGNVYYRAVTNGFSHFAISYEKDGAVMDLTAAAPVSTPLAVSTPAQSTPAPASPTATTVPAPATETAGKFPVTFVVIAIVVVLIVAVGGIALYRRRQEELPDWWYQEEE